MHRLIVVFGFVALVGSASSAVARSVDAPRIVPWTQIGGVRLGDERSVATALYGAPTKVFRERTPVGTRWYGHRVFSYRYTVPRGVIWVTAVDGRVRALGTSSPRYRTPDGLHVGSTIPLGRCHVSAANPCDYRWRGFSWEECPAGWRAYKPGLDILLSTKNVFGRPGRVSRVGYIEFGDPSAMLLCF